MNGTVVIQGSPCPQVTVSPNRTIVIDNDSFHDGAPRPDGYLFADNGGGMYRGYKGEVRNHVEDFVGYFSSDEIITDSDNATDQLKAAYAVGEYFEVSKHGISVNQGAGFFAHIQDAGYGIYTLLLNDVDGVPALIRCAKQYNVFHPFNFYQK
jgi:hypothetical protein